MRSIKTKLIAAIALLILVSFTVSGYFLIQQKTIELSEDLYRNALSFAELTNDSIIFDFENFYLTDSGLDQLQFQTAICDDLFRQQGS